MVRESLELHALAARSPFSEHKPVNITIASYVSVNSSRARGTSRRALAHLRKAMSCSAPVAAVSRRHTNANRRTDPFLSRPVSNDAACERSAPKRAHFGYSLGA